ncbi:MAG: glycosyltransferase, partial [Planctomycetaceae bacterium]|nr:glycosyltransferase [Planctomycetaceae bacterium]
MSTPLTECRCLGAGWCDRHQVRKTAHWVQLCRNRPSYFRMWEEGTGPGQTVSGHARLSPSAPERVAVAVICHNYGRFLEEALESILTQTRRADEILVVDDASTDDSAEVARRYDDRGVRYVRVDVRNVHQARRAGFENTAADAICFLDADDKLGSDYLAQGLSQFVDPSVAVVYSDVELFGNATGRSFYRDFDAGALHQDNFIHAGSLVRREALEATRPFDIEINPLQVQGDWFLWRRVLQGNWTARKQAGTYFYRQHQSNWMHEMRRVDSPKRYFDYAGLAHEIVTRFVPLSGRSGQWPQLSKFLSRQSWPHRQTRLVLVDTSRDNAFHATVRKWLSQSDYFDVRHLIHPVDDPGLADADRRDSEIRRRVVRAMWRIYGLLPQVAETEYVWVLEDDVLPPDDVCERLLRGFDSRTASVAAPYQSRYHDVYLVWDQHGVEAVAPRNGIEVVGGNGFGCVILRRSAISGHVFSRYKDAEDFDIAFYRRLGSSELVAKVDWSCLAQHGAEPPPGRVRQIVHFGQAIMRHAVDGFQKVDDETYQARLAACTRCASCDGVNWICREKSCGCRIKIKAGWRSESCPLGHSGPAHTNSCSRRGLASGSRRSTRKGVASSPGSASPDAASEAT